MQTYNLPKKRVVNFTKERFWQKSFKVARREKKKRRERKKVEIALFRQ
jgi:lipopolysaccharide biosynthesis regulator YciM